MSGWRFVLRGLAFHWRIHAAVALGVAAATAVLVGALIVGDSVRGSLRSLTLDRLGRIDELLITDRFFRASLADEIAASDRVKDSYEFSAPAILLPQGTLERRVEGKSTRASQVLVIGADERFWQFDSPTNPRREPGIALGAGEIAVNEPLANDLGAEVGDLVTVRLPKADQVPADSPLAKKNDRTRSLAQLRVKAIVPAEGLGAFSLTPSQRTSRCVYLSLKQLQDALRQPGRVNAILIAGRDETSPPPLAASEGLNGSLTPTLGDYGFAIDRIRMTFPSPPTRGVSQEAAETVVYDYYHLTTDRLIFDEAAENSVQAAFNDDAQRALTYLANDIAKVSADDKSGKSSGIPYSTVTAIDSRPVLGPLLDESGQPISLADDEIALTDWAANDQKAQIGDTIRLSWFEPETTHGDAVEASRDFKLKAILPLTEPAKPFGRRGRQQIPPIFDKPPTILNDPHFTPEVEGITDQDTIENWDPPFPFDYDRMRSSDDEYWKRHHATPKAYISLAAGQAASMWGSRFGDVTSYRLAAPAGLPAEGDEAEKYLRQLETRWLKSLADEKAALGFTFRPLKREGLAASSGATPFDALFLSLSTFVIAAALLLASLLFRLGVEQRASELGLLMAVGVSQKRARRLFVIEGTVVALAGGLPGVLLGIGYAALIIALLRDPDWWLGAVGSPFLQLHIGPLSLIGGYLAGAAASAAAIWLAVWQTRKAPARRLLAGVVGEANAAAPVGKLSSIVAITIVVAALVLAVLATQLGGEAQAGAFVGGGALLLAGLLLFVWRALRTRAGGSLATAGPLALARMAMRSAARNPARSTLTIGLMAAACFLILSMSAFRLAPSREGAGGFDLIAESSQPIFADLNTPEGRKEALGDRADDLHAASVASFRVQAGDDASCNNLYQASQPRVWGVPKSFAKYKQAFGFNWSPLFAERPAGDPVPVVIDKNTAMYSLHLYKGVGEEFEVDYPSAKTGGEPVRFRVAGLLSNSVLQGGLLIGEPDFLRLFPDVSGYRLFLIRSPQMFKDSAKTDDQTLGFGASPTVMQTMVTATLEDRLSEQGFDVRRSYDVLQELLAVQNTYLSTFQSLGALGLLLGSFGLAAVQLRSVFERRKELALLRATGFRRGRLAQLVMLENGLLLVAGLLVGLIAAAAAVAPHAFVAGAQPPGVDLAIMLAAILIVGLLAGLLAVRAALRAPLLAALRGA